MWLRSAYYHVPHDIRQLILVRRRSPLWVRTGIIFVHIPKAAGTSINQALFGRFMGHARASDIERWGSTQLKALPSFAVTRNPWDRLVSAYRFSKRGRGTGGVQQAWVWRPEQYQVPEFATFASFVNDWLPARDITKVDHMFQPQSLFVCDSSGKLLVDHVGQVENLDTTYDFIHKHTGSRPVVARSNFSGKPVDYRDFYTPDMIETVGRLYAEDVARFGYQFSGMGPGGASWT